LQVIFWHLIEKFDQLIRSSEIRSSDPLSPNQPHVFAICILVWFSKIPMKGAILVFPFSLFVSCVATFKLLLSYLISSVDIISLNRRAIRISALVFSFIWSGISGEKEFLKMVVLRGLFLVSYSYILIIIKMEILIENKKMIKITIMLILYMITFLL